MQQHILHAHGSVSVYLLAVASPYLLCSCISRGVADPPKPNTLTHPYSITCQNYSGSCCDWNLYRIYTVPIWSQ